MTAQMPIANGVGLSTTQPTGETIEQEWWVQRWVDLLNTYRFKKRLERGRMYAREGNILHLEFRNGKVHAVVQGTAPEPYKLTISLEQFTDEDWGFIVTSMAEKAIYAAKLLAGTMPDDIESVFTSNGLSLFPFKLGEVRSRCNCPDPQNPCKHIAAVYYQLGDFFREDPFVLFQLRGRTKTEILESIRLQRSGLASSPSAISKANSSERVEVDGAGLQSSDLKKEAGASDESNTPGSLATTELESSPVPESSDSAEGVNEMVEAKEMGDHQDPELDLSNLNLDAFWQYNEPLDPSLVVITPPGSAQTVLDVLGKLPLAPNDAQTVRQYLDTVYQSVSQQAMITALNRNT